MTGSCGRCVHMLLSHLLAVGLRGVRLPAWASLSPFRKWVRTAPQIRQVVHEQSWACDELLRSSRVHFLLILRVRSQLALRRPEEPAKAAELTPAVSPPLTCFPKKNSSSRGEAGGLPAVPAAWHPPHPSTSSLLRPPTFCSVLGTCLRKGLLKDPAVGEFSGGKQLLRIMTNLPSNGTAFSPAFFNKNIQT